MTLYISIMSDGKNILTNPTILKGLFSFAVAGTLDRFALGVADTKNNAIFAGSVASGIVVGNLIGGTIPSVIQDSTYYAGKTIAQRAFEVGFGGAAAYGLNMAFAKADYGDVYKRLGVIVATDFIAEYACDFITGNPLAYLV
jgi:hypothetical protein